MDGDPDRAGVPVRARHALTEMFGPRVAVSVWGVDVTDVHLFPEEEIALARAVEKRRVEFARGRSCARTALMAAGGDSVAIPVGPNREPLFPAGWAGSITHCDGFVAAVVARQRRAILEGLGIDAEPVVHLEDGVVDLILTHHDAEARRSPERTSIVFSAKEAVFKAVFPAVGVWIDFADVGLDVSPDGSGGSFRVGWTAPTVDVPALHRIEGRWCVVDDLVVTGCWVGGR